MAVKAEVSVVRATAGSPGRSRSKRHTNSAEKCCASAGTTVAATENFVASFEGCRYAFDCRRNGISQYIFGSLLGVDAGLKQLHYLLTNTHIEPSA